MFIIIIQNSACCRILKIKYPSKDVKKGKHSGIAVEMRDSTRKLLNLWCDFPYSTLRFFPRRETRLVHECHFIDTKSKLKIESIHIFVIRKQ